MRLATLDLTPELFIEFCKACTVKGVARAFIVKENPLPDDASIVRIGLRDANDPYTLQLHIQSSEFEEVSDGSIPPELPLVFFETIFDERRDGLLLERMGDAAVLGASEIQ